MGRANVFFGSGWRAAALAWAALLSPLGAPVQVYLLHWSGWCLGALGTGVSCDVGFLSGYFERLSLAVEVSFIALVGIGWLLIGVLLAISAVSWTVRAVFRTLRT